MFHVFLDLGHMMATPPQISHEFADFLEKKSQDYARNCGSMATFHTHTHTIKFTVH